MGYKEYSNDAVQTINEEELLQNITEMIEVLPIAEKVRLFSYLQSLYFS